MKHPLPETWMSYLYRELPAAEHADAEAHLHVCPQCRTSVERWRGAMTALDRDEASLALPARHGGTHAWQPVVRLALAASVVLVAGFLVGRAAGPSRADVQREVAVGRQQVETELKRQFREELKAVTAGTVTTTAEENRRLLADFARELQAARVADRRELLTALDTLDSRRAIDAETLRASLLTLARKTGSSFQQTESQMNLLAANLPANTPASSLNSLPVENKP